MILRNCSIIPKKSRKAKKLRKLHKAQGCLCALCGKPLKLEDANLDHISPASKGGTYRVANLRATHVECNKARGVGSSSDLFVELDGIVALRHNIKEV